MMSYIVMAYIVMATSCLAMVVPMLRYIVMAYIVLSTSGMARVVPVRQVLPRRGSSGATPPRRGMARLEPLVWLWLVLPVAHALALSGRRGLLPAGAKLPVRRAAGGGGGDAWLSF